MSGERICAQSLLEQLRGEVRETLSGFEQIGDEELYDCIGPGHCGTGRTAVSAAGAADRIEKQAV